MEIDEALLTLPINPNNFPAKLWRLVNSPVNPSIRWDPCGDGIVIDQQMFEADLLSPINKQLAESSDLFKTTNFTSFIRQLNLYGFRKMIHVAAKSDKQGGDDPVTDVVQHRFHNPNFKQGHPELLVNLKRLTTSNKAKIEAGLEVNYRQPSRFRRRQFNSPEENSDIRGSVGQTRREYAAPYQYHSDSSCQLKEYDRAPRSSSAWVMGHGEESSATFYTDKGVPVSVIRRDSSCTIQSSPTTEFVQHGPQNVSAVGQKFSHTFIPHHSQYRTGIYAPAVCHGCTPGSLDSDMACSHHPAASYYHYGYYPTYSVGCLHPSVANPVLQVSDNVDPKRNDVNLDTVFKIVGELQGSPKVHVAKMSTPEKPPSFSTSKSRSPAAPPHNLAVSAFKPASGLASSQHGVPHTLSSRALLVEPSPVAVEGGIVAVAGNVPSCTGATVGTPSYKPKTRAGRSLEQGPSQAEATPMESSKKAAGTAKANLSEEQARG